MANNLKHFGELVGESIREQLPGKPEKYTSRALTSPDEIEAARRLSTTTFVELGKIDPKEVGPDGLLVHDRLLPLSTYFGVFNKAGELEATSRLLWTPELTIDELRLPVGLIKPEYQDYLRGHAPGQIAEIGSLAKADKDVSTVAVLKLLRSMWTFAGERGVKTFTCGLEPKVFPSFRAMFGNALTELADGTVEFPGIKGQQKPLMIDVWRAVENQDGSQHRSALERWQRRLIGGFIVRDLKDEAALKR